MTKRITGKLLGIAIKESKRSPMVLKEWLNVTTKQGVDGDHRGGPGARQVTVISQDSWDKACQDLDKSLPWIARRANLLVGGVELKDSGGKFLKIGELVLGITGETKPCQRMDEYCQGLQEVLKPEWRGGVSCKVIKSGSIKVDDIVRLSDLIE